MSTAADVQLEFNAQALEKALRYRYEYSQRSFEKVFKDTMRSFTRKLFRVTPPGNSKFADAGKSFAAIRKTGEAAIAGDISRVFTSKKDLLADPESKQKKKDNSDMAFMRREHKAARGQNGRIPKSRKPRFLAFQRDIRAFTKKQQQRVGYLSAGWVSAAQKVGATVPNWISRHSGQSLVKIVIDKNASKFLFEAQNLTPYAGAIPSLKRYLARAMYMEAGNIERQVRGFQIAYYSGKL